MENESVIFNKQEVVDMINGWAHSVHSYMDADELFAAANQIFETDKLPMSVNDIDIDEYGENIEDDDDNSYCDEEEDD
jgi:recombination DNA repair RAD52 pathway protein